MSFLGKRTLLFLQLFLTSVYFLAVARSQGEATYAARGSFHRWSDAKQNCKNTGQFLAKIKDVQELQKAKQAFIQYQDPVYWVGIKFDPSLSDFIWADGTVVPSNANFEAIVNRNEQVSAGYTKRCMYISNQDTLTADDCESHYKYICQAGENDDAAKITISSTYPSTLFLSLSLLPSPLSSSSSSRSSAAFSLTPSSTPEKSAPLSNLSPVLAASTPSVQTTPSLALPSLPLFPLPSPSAAASSSPSAAASSSSSSPSSAAASSSPSAATSSSSSSSSSSSLSLSSLPASSPSSSTLAYSSPYVSITHTVDSTRTQHIPSAVNMVNEHATKINQLNVNDPASLESAVNVTSSLLKEMNKIQDSGLTTNILVSCNKLETFVLQYARYHMNNSQAEMSIEEDELALTVMKIPADLETDVVFPSTKASFGKSFNQKEKNAITLPSSLFSAQERYAVCLLYNNVAELMPEQANEVDNRKDSSIGSLIISCTLSPEVEGVFTDRVVIKLKTTKKDKANVMPSCVFWDFSISTNYNGAWSTEGCTVTESTQEQTTCSCNHLTNFAVLMEVGETKISDRDKFALEIITYIGTSLSLVGEVITILVYIVLMNLKSTQSHIRLNMVICLATAQVVFMIGISATGEKVLCITVAITINYFYLAAFGWMVMEGVMLYLKVVKVFNVTTTTKYFYGFAWGFPTMLVIGAVITNILLNGSFSNSMREDVCWFSFKSGFVWVFVGPVLAACLVNLAILSRILVEMVRLKDMSGISETSTTRQSLKACAVLSPLLGFAWMFGVLAVTTAGLVFQYLFTILNSLQGFFIFVFHVVRSKEIRNALETRKQRWETTRSVSIAKEKSTLGRGRSSAARERKSLQGIITMNKISPETQDNQNLPTIM